MGGGGSFEIGRPRSRGWKSFEPKWTKRWGVLKIGRFSWTSFMYHLLREKCPYLEFFWYIFFHIRTKYLSVFSLHVGKYGPEKLGIRTLSTHYQHFAD